jgi:putative Mn2+ efflux pump MntP
MSFLEILLVSFGVAMDAFAVSVSAGVVVKKIKFRQALLIGVFFGGFQVLMPLIGWSGGNACKQFIESFDHWAAFTLLVLVGGKMLYEACGKKEEDEEPADPFKLKILFIMALATSIDALAVGVTFSFVNVPLLLSVSMMGIVTFIFSIAGVYIGGLFGHLFERKFEFAGGLVIILIGVKILIDHLWKG